METTRRPRSLAIILLGLGVVLFAVGAKLALIQRYGTDQPYADQWAAEGMYLLRGPLYYKVDFNQMISPHGEHRPALTRLGVRALIAANAGQWDCFVELVANLLIYGAFLAVAWRGVAASVKRSHLALMAVMMAVLFALPGNYENFLWGFQSCFLFMLLTGLLHITLTMASTRLGGCWGLAQAAGLLGLFSIAAGSMSAAVLVTVAALELLRGRRDAWVWTTLAVNLLLFWLGYRLLPATLVPEGGWFARLGQVATGMGSLLSWPFAGVWWSLLLQAPWVVLTGVTWCKRPVTPAAGDGLVTVMGAWVVGLAFAIAFGRAVTSANIGNRYCDVLILGLFVNGLALVRFDTRLAPRWRRLWRSAGVAWLLFVAWGLWQYNKPADLGVLFKYQHDLAVEQRQIVRDFLVTSDPARLQAFEQTSHRFPHFQITLDFLRDPKVPPLLPPSLTPDGHAGPLSRLAVHVAAGWSGVMGLGVLLLFIGLIRLRGSTPRPEPVPRVV